MPSTRRAHGAERLGALLFVAAIFASAFLIFLVQPMVGKRILPWFGGAPGVWMLCLTFYQVTLFLGYAYAHLLIRFVSPSLQVALHALVFGSALLALPVLPTSAWAPDGPGEPSTSILAMLSVNVALPFLLLAATGPLVQAWFAGRYPERSPYPLYAVSNVGSLLALLGYPFVIEPLLTLSSTSDMWSLAFVVTGTAVLGCAVLAWCDRPEARGGTESPGATAPLRPLRVALWCLLAGAAVVLLMGVTNRLCLDLASVPFLWILPLATYLASFILCFGSERVYRRVHYVAIAAFAVLLCYGKPLWSHWLPQSFVTLSNSAIAEIAFHCLLLFATCMVMHGELCRLRPAAGFLTAFYLCVSGGGAVGGIFVGVVAPRVFNGYYELPVGIGLAWLLLLLTCWHTPYGWLRADAPRWRWGVVGSLSLVLAVVSGARMIGDADRLLYQERTFFGVLRVIRSQKGRAEHWRLFNGSTLHGVQFRYPEFRRFPTAYYGRATGLGLALGQQGSRSPRRVGAVGLGVGTIAAYGRPGDLFRFYEIDPAVIRLATVDGYFTFLSDSRAEIEIVSGDGRLSLAAEQARGLAQAFDVLIIDAFSSDAIPVHLLTREAFDVYAGALADDGLMAIHVSNRYFHLAPLVLRLGRSLEMSGLRIRNDRVPAQRSTRAAWIFLSRDLAKLRSLAAFAVRRSERFDYARPVIRLVPRGEALMPETTLWTDDYSDLFGLLKIRVAIDSPAPAANFSRQLPVLE